MRIGLRYASNEYRAGLVERPVQQALVEVLRPGDSFFDVGANVGFFTLVASRSVGHSGSLHAFEARSDIARVAQRNLRRNGLSGEVLNVAVGDSDGTVELFVADHPGGSTIERSQAASIGRTEIVQQVTIDRLVASGRLPIPNVVKIDVEGAEPAVIRGMSTTLREHRPIVIFELDDQDSTRVESQFLEMQDRLADLGYRCERLAPSYADVSWQVIHAVARAHTAPGQG